MNTRYWSGGFLYDPAARAVLLHQRDGNTKFNPNKWAFFGGLNEGEEDPVACFLREVFEELGLAARREQVVPLRDYLNTELDTYRHVFYVVSDVKKEDLTLGEGAGFDWVPLSRIGEYDLTDRTREDLAFFLREVQ
jgi:8-oxo-dGTP pyrophosphatase MutT (NUDIX family)